MRLFLTQNLHYVTLKKNKNRITDKLNSVTFTLSANHSPS